MIAADFNGDQRLDVAAVAEGGSNELRWWRNEGRPKKCVSNLPSTSVAI